MHVDANCPLLLLLGYRLGTCKHGLLLSLSNPLLLEWVLFLSNYQAFGQFPIWTYVHNMVCKTVTSLKSFGSPLLNQSLHIHIYMQIHTRACIYARKIRCVANILRCVHLQLECTLEHALVLLFKWLATLWAITVEQIQQSP